MKDVTKDGGRHTEDTALSTQKVCKEAGNIAAGALNSLPALAVPPASQQETETQLKQFTALIFKRVTSELRESSYWATHTATLSNDASSILSNESDHFRVDYFGSQSTDFFSLPKSGNPPSHS